MRNFFPVLGITLAFMFETVSMYYIDLSLRGWFSFYAFEAALFSCLAVVSLLISLSQKTLFKNLIKIIHGK